MHRCLPNETQHFDCPKNGLLEWGNGRLCSLSLKGRHSGIPDTRPDIITAEWTAAFDEANNFLERQQCLAVAVDSTFQNVIPPETIF
jgi:hypothetical protein